MNKRLAFGVLLASAAVSLSIPFSTAEAATVIGRVVAVKGAPSASGPAGDRKLSSGSAVYEDDKISVGAGGNAQIILKDDTRLVVGPSSSLLLDRFLMKGGSTAQKVSIKTLRGTFRFITGKSAKSAYEIKTSSATIGIRGTGFDWWDRAQTGVAVMDGSVKLCSGGDCVSLSDSCEVGRAGKGKASELRGGSAGRLVSSNLPYIINQSPLRTPFHLLTSKCDEKIKRSKMGRGGMDEIGPPEDKYRNKG
jgi:hypothetical protein